MVSSIRLAALLLLFGMASAAADDLGQPADLYTTRVIVTGADTRSRPEGFRMCLEDVLAKASGDMKLPDDPRVRKLGEKAGDLIDAYSYYDRMTGRPIHDEQGTRDRPYYLTCAFNAAKVDAALAALGRKPWPGDRTPLTMVLAVQGLGHNDMLSSDGDFDPDMRAALTNTAMRYGLTVTLPSLNALAENAVTVESAAKSPAARLTALAERSGGALPLVGSLDWSDADHGWIAHWMLDDGRKRHAWGVKGVSYDEAFRSAVRGAALILSGNGEPEAGL